MNKKKLFQILFLLVQGCEDYKEYGIIIGIMI